MAVYGRLISWERFGEDLSPTDKEPEGELSFCAVETQKLT